MNGTNTKTKFISPEDIHAKAMSTLGIYGNLYGTSLPIDAEKFLEKYYGMQIIPLPGIKYLGIECSLSRDGTTILVAQEDYENEAFANRLRFTFAHELAHVVLHARHLSAPDTLSDSQRDWLEKQARMFAAYFLMPEPVILGVLASKVVPKLDALARNQLTMPALADHFTNDLAGYFGVSVEAMSNRLKNVELSKTLEGPYIALSDKQRFDELSKVVEQTDTTWVMSSDLFKPALS